jgi:hypothetical protein
MWLFARAYHVAGVELPGSPARKAAVVIVAIVVAATIAFWPLIEAVRQLGVGDLGGLIGVFSAAGDVVTFALIAPIFMTALALRGGVLVWPWSLLAASNLAWLLYDAQSVLALLLARASGHTVESWGELWRAIACALTLAAGLAQRKLSAEEPAP